MKKFEIIVYIPIFAVLFLGTIVLNWLHRRSIESGIKEEEDNEERKKK